MDREQPYQQVALPNLTMTEKICFPIGVVAAFGGVWGMITAESPSKLVANGLISAAGAVLAYKNIGPPTRFEPAAPQERNNAMTQIGGKKIEELDVVDMALLRYGSAEELFEASMSAYIGLNGQMLGYLGSVAFSRETFEEGQNYDELDPNVTFDPDTFGFGDVWRWCDDRLPTTDPTRFTWADELNQVPLN